MTVGRWILSAVTVGLVTFITITLLAVAVVARGDTLDRCTAAGACVDGIDHPWVVAR